MGTATAMRVKCRSPYRMTSVGSSTEDCNGSKEVVSEGKGRETDRGGSRESKLLCKPLGLPPQFCSLNRVAFRRDYRQ